jgi:uncharacterized membrane protein YkgB
MKAVHSLSRSFPLVARIAIFLVYVWFGLVKLTGLSGATPLAEALTRQTIGTTYFGLAFTLLAIYECVVGVLFLIPATDRIAVALLLIHLAIVCSPLLLVPHAAWTAPFVPTLEGQYIIKNVLLLALALGISTTSWRTPSPKRQPEGITRQQLRSPTQAQGKALASAPGTAEDRDHDASESAAARRQG